MANEVMTNEQKCIALISKLNEKALSTVLLFLEGVADQERHLKTTPVERVQEIEEYLEKKDAIRKEEIRASQQRWQANVIDLQKWIDEKTSKVELPNRFDIHIGDIMTIYEGLKYNIDDMLIDTVTAVYSYGFRRGCNYTKKKAATRTAK